MPYPVYALGVGSTFSISATAENPDGAAAVMDTVFSEKFYANCRRCLRTNGVLVTQNGVPFLQKKELAGTMAKFHRLFADASCYIAAIPTYVGGHMAMGFASNDKRLRRHPVKTIAQRYRKAGGFTTQYWTPDVHVAAFAQPRFIADVVAKARARDRAAR